MHRQKLKKLLRLLKPLHLLTRNTLVLALWLDVIAVTSKPPTVWREEV
jgi:hypothetical protein